MCRQWSGRRVFGASDRYSPYYQYSDTPSGTYFCVAQVDPSAGETGYAITLGVPFDHSRWFRGRESTIRTRSRCPDGDCCQRAPAALAERSGFLTHELGDAMLVLPGALAVAGRKATSAP